MLGKINYNRDEGLINRFPAALFGTIAVLCLVSEKSLSGPTIYDMSSLLFQPHPFSIPGQLPPVVAAPLPPSQIRAPARMPHPTIPPRAASRQAAQLTVFERKPATIPQLIAPNSSQATSNNGFKEWVSEIRFGAFVHDEGAFTRNEEEGFDGNLEFLFVSPDFLKFIWEPRPHLGATINSKGDTSQAYMGLSWEWSFFGSWFGGFSLGGAVHDGKLSTNRIDRKELGCRVLFRESVEVGYRFGGRHGISGYLDHISNAKLCNRNEGLEDFGIRYGYKF